MARPEEYYQPTLPDMPPLEEPREQEALPLDISDKAIVMDLLDDLHTAVDNMERAGETASDEYGALVSEFNRIWDFAIDLGYVDKGELSV